MLKALHEFYANTDPILTAMIEHAYTQREDPTDDRQAELTALSTHIAATEAAINRYHAAFEAGTMDDTIAGPRIRDLREQLTQQQARRSALETELVDRPTAPEPDTLARVRTYLQQVMTTGTTAARKAAIESLIAEVQLTDQGVVPVFKIPTQDTPMPPPNPDGGTNEDGSPVRTMVRSVERTMHHANQTIMVTGAPMPGRLTAAAAYPPGKHPTATGPRPHRRPAPPLETTRAPEPRPAPSRVSDPSVEDQPPRTGTKPARLGMRTRQSSPTPRTPPRRRIRARDRTARSPIG